jgi:4-amino-4-deoxy-L-arabinose transferase-like glycosyltransferase
MDALPLDSPMLLPLALRPPMGPRILRALVVALAVIFHVVTDGWSLITNGAEGDFAGTARVLMRNHRWLPPFFPGSTWSGPPLAVWLSKASMNHFGASEFSVRLPVALAVVAVIWFTFRLAERFGGTWRGFVAAMIVLCSPGMFTLGRILSPAPLAAAFVTATFYCLSCGARRRPSRRQWYGLAWIAFAFSYFSGGGRAAAVPFGTVLTLLAFFPEARIRFLGLLSREGALILVLTAAGAIGTGGFHWRPLGASAAGLELPAWKMGCLLFGMLLPWSLLLIPAANNVIMRLATLQRLEWDEAFPLAWLAVGLVLSMACPGGNLFDTLLIFPAFAVWAALRLQTLPRKSWLRAGAAILVLAVTGLLLTSLLRFVLPRALPNLAESIRALPGFFWPSVTPVDFIAVLAFALFAAAAFWLEWQHRRRFALLALFGAMIPAGYAFADTAAKFAPYFSYADFAHCISASRDASPLVAVDASRTSSSSLRFYLEEPLQPFEALEPAGGDALKPLLESRKRVFFITGRNRLEAWKPELDGRLRIACESGGNLLFTNAEVQR